MPPVSLSSGQTTIAHVCRFLGHAARLVLQVTNDAWRIASHFSHALTYRTERQLCWPWLCAPVTSMPRRCTRTLRLRVRHNEEAFGARSSIFISYGSGCDGDGFAERTSKDGPRGDRGGTLEAKTAVSDDDARNCTKRLGPDEAFVLVDAK